MRYCGSVDTVPAYQRVKKQPHSPEHYNTRPTKDKSTQKNGHIMYKLQINSDDEQGEGIEEVESLGKSLSYSPDAPKALGIASKRSVRSSRNSCRKGLDNKAPSLHTSKEPYSNISIANLLVRYQSIVESSSSSSLSSSSSASPSTNSPHNHFMVAYRH